MPGNEARVPGTYTAGAVATGKTPLHSPCAPSLSRRRKISDVVPPHSRPSAPFLAVRCCPSRFRASFIDWPLRPLFLCLFRTPVPLAPFSLRPTAHCSNWLADDPLPACSHSTRPATPVATHPPPVAFGVRVTHSTRRLIVGPFSLPGCCD